MGILLANMPGFALPGPAYFSPLAWGGHGPAEIAVWLANFVFVEGKMRGLFSLLFGASMLVVIERAQASGRNPATVHYPRMAVLLLFGLIQMYLIWWGDILSHYAIVGSIAFLFARMRAEQLLAAALVTLALTLVWSLGGLFALIEAAPRNTREAVDTWNAFSWTFGVPPGDWATGQIAAMRGAWPAQVGWRLANLDSPVGFLLIVGPETLSAMLFGMWAYRSGLLTGQWSRGAYKHLTLIGLGLAFAGYLALGTATIVHNFDQRWTYFGAIVASTPFRILGTLGYAALIILLMKPGGWLTERLSAVGRAAFSNYLGTSILVTAIFYGWGLGQFARWDRVTIYLVPPVIWLLMLLWSKPWLKHFRYGPLEWLWRTLARGQLQPMRKAVGQS